MASTNTGTSLKNPRWEKFCRLFVAGDEDVVGNAKRSYIEAGYKARGHAAESAASRLLRKDEVRRRIDELREVALDAARARLREWGELAPEAQATIAEIMREGERGDGVRLRAARTIIERAEGPATLKFKDSEGRDRDAAPAVFVLGGVGPDDLHPPEE